VTASAAGAIASPSAFGQSTPNPSSPHGNAVNPMLSTPVIANAAADLPKICLASSTHDSGHTTTAIAAHSMFAATGMVVPVVPTSSAARSCQAAG
jgi:hypothetical protein